MRKVFCITFFSFVLFLLAPLSGFSASLSDFRLEGIVMGGDEDEADVAVLNGELFTVGDKIADYELLEINPSFLRLKNVDTGDLKRLWVEGSRPSDEILKVLGEERIQGDDDELVEEEEIEDVIIVEPNYDEMGGLEKLRLKIRSFLLRMGPLQGYWEKNAQSNVKVVFNAVNSFYEDEKVVPSKIDQLIEEGYLSYKFGFDDYDGYKYSIRKLKSSDRQKGEKEDFMILAYPAHRDVKFGKVILDSEGNLQESQSTQAGDAAEETVEAAAEEKSDFEENEPTNELEAAES